MLLAGKRSDDGRGADVVIEDMADLPPLVAAFAAGGGAGEGARDGRAALARVRQILLVLPRTWLPYARLLAKLPPPRLRLPLLASL